MFASLAVAVALSQIAQPAQTALKIEDVKLGTGEGVKNYDLVEAYCTGTLTNGKEFYSNVKSGKPLLFQIGVGKVIKGWDLGFIGLKLNGERNLTIPPDLGYGTHAMGDDIPANSTLKFFVKLVKVYPSSKVTIVTEGKGDSIKLNQFLICKLSLKSSLGKELSDPTREARLQLSKEMWPWVNQAVGGIKVGEKRKVVVPSEIAYGKAGKPAKDENGKKAGSDVPPNSDLTMEIEALKFVE